MYYLNNTPHDYYRDRYELCVLHELEFFFLIYFISTLIKNGVVDDGVPAILHYRPSDLYLADSKETMMVEVGKNIPTRLSMFANKAFPHSAFSLTR